MQPFVHLHSHTEFSLLDGISRLPDMVRRAKELNQPALAITDHGNMYAAIYFYKECMAQGIKPIIGCEVYVTENSRFDRPEGRSRERLKHLILLAETMEGYRNLVKIVSKASTEGMLYRPRADRDLLRQYSKGIIALSACIQGEIPQYILQDNMEGAKRSIEWYIETYGKDNFFLEIQNHGLPEEAKAQEELIKLSKEYGLGIVASNDFHYVLKEDADAQDIKVCISTGRRRAEVDRLKFPNDEFYLKSGDEMAQLFSHIPGAIENTLKIAERCNVEFNFDEHHLPHFDVPEGETSKTYLRKVCEQEIPRLYGETSEELQKRLDYELDVIGTMGFEDYFLIVWDYVRYAREHDILVGPGRGSAAGSVVAYLLGITGLDPLKYDLLFERFLNPERVSMPDIDIDFCYEKRGQAIEYVTRKYGQERVSQIITFGTEAARAVIRDVGRVLDLPLAEVNRIAKMIPNELGITLDKALQGKELKALYEADPNVKELFDFGKKLEGIARNSSTHAAGVVISADPLDDHVPVQNANEEGFVTQYDKDNIEELGLLKMDFLGLRTLTVMGDALKLIKANRGIDLDLDAIPLDDKAACDILTKGDTSGVFQLESEGITKLVMDLKPEHFEDLIPLVALYRPGPLGSGMVADFIDRRHGKKEVTYLHPILEPILKDTFGVILYQEQVMQIASAMGGFSLGQADLMRRAMGKKKESVLKAQRESFIQGSINNGIEESIANEVFDLLVYFAGYGFNKSHSAAYAYIAYQTAYLKAHYFPEFMAATMSSELDNTDQLKVFFDDAQRPVNGIRFLPPDINQSFYRFIPNANNEIRYALGAIKGTGEAVVNQIVAEREANGAFTGLLDFCERMGKHINRRSVEALIRGGAFDALEPNRAMLLANVDLALQNAEQKHQSANQGGLFDMFDDVIDDIQMQPAPAWSEAVQLAEEKTAIGFYLSGHPFSPYREEVRRVAPVSLAKLSEQDGTQRVAGFATSIRTIMTKRGKMLAIMLEDDESKQEVLVQGDILAELPREVLQADQILICDCRVYRNESGELRLNANTVRTLNQARVAYADCLTLTLQPAHDIDALAQLLLPHTQMEEERRIGLRFRYQNERAYGELLPAPQWRIALTEPLLAALAHLLGDKAISID